MQDAGCMGDTHELGTDFQEREKCYEFLWLILWYSELLDNVGGTLGHASASPWASFPVSSTPFPGFSGQCLCLKRGRSQCCDEKG